MMQAASSMRVKDDRSGKLLLSMRFTGLADALDYLSNAQLFCEMCEHRQAIEQTREKPSRRLRRVRKKTSGKSATVSLFAESTIENFLVRWNSISADWLSCLSFNNTSYMDDREKQDCHVLRAWENA